VLKLWKLYKNFKIKIQTLMIKQQQRNNNMAGQAQRNVHTTNQAHQKYGGRGHCGKT
jgi:hypothetical protein